MVHKRKKQSKSEQLIITGFIIILLLSTGFMLLRFLIPVTRYNGTKGVNFIEIPSQVGPNLEEGVKNRPSEEKPEEREEEINDEVLVQ
jgi:hypothetical protein